MGQALGAIGSYMNWRNPADVGMGYLGQIPETIKPYLEPYMQAGQWALPRMEQQYGQLMQDPGAVMSRIGAGYQQSPGYQFNVDQATKAAHRAAAAGGMLGSPQEQQQLAGTVSGLANQDYYNYLNKAMGLYQSGLGGAAGLGQMGQRAGSEMATDLAQALMSQASMGYAGQQAANQASGGLWGALGSI